MHKAVIIDKIFCNIAKCCHTKQVEKRLYIIPMTCSNMFLSLLLATPFVRRFYLSINSCIYQRVIARLLLVWLHKWTKNFQYFGNKKITLKYETKSDLITCLNYINDYIFENKLISISFLWIFSCSID